MILHDLFDWSNSGVGLAGLALTVGALWQATGAKRAATEAKEAVYRRNAADSFAEILRLAEQFATWVECERRAEAVVQVREIVLRMARDRGEYDRFLGSDADKMKSVESSCQRLGDSLGYSEFPAGATEKRELFGETLKIVQDLSGILGRIRARSDQEGR
jgi:dsDNA-binding SOS-regulon protein